MGVGTLVAIEENSGRRNWSRCKEYTDVLNSNTLLFQDDCVTQAALSELSQQDQQAIHPAVASCIDLLLSQKKHGDNVQVQLDTHLLVSLLPLSLQSFFLDKIDLLSPHLLHPDHVDDIGYIVRNVLMHKTRICILSKIYHFTMPFIKHNRLNFPPMRFVSKSHLMHMLQIISLTCLGLQTSSTKQPTWTIRRQLFVFFFNLSTRGSLRDIYLFIQHHTYLLRLALMEHFMNFVKKHMVQELKVMQSCNVFRYDFVRIHRLVQYITDTFRMTSMQGENLDWDTIEGKAQVSVERCNRSCKTNTPIPFSPRVNLSQSINAKTFRKILEMPALNATTLMQSCQDHDLFFTAARWTLSKTICKFPLPFFLQYRQFAQVQSKSFEPFNKTLISRSLLYVCLRCNQTHSEARTDMRLCCPCQSSFQSQIREFGNLLKGLFGQGGQAGWPGWPGWLARLASCSLG